MNSLTCDFYALRLPHPLFHHFKYSLFIKPKFSSVLYFVHLDHVYSSFHLCHSIQTLGFEETLQLQAPEPRYFLLSCFVASSFFEHHPQLNV